MGIDEARTHAAQLLEVDEAVLEPTDALLRDAEGFVFWEPSRGGRHLLVGHDGTVLASGAHRLLDAVVADFRAGKRTEPMAFRWR